MSVLSVRLTTGASLKNNSVSALTLLPLHAATTNCDDHETLHPELT